MKKLVCLLIIVALSLVGCGEKAVAPVKNVPFNSVPLNSIPVVEKKWVVTNTFEGNGEKNTEDFSISKNTRITWEVGSENTWFSAFINKSGENVGNSVANVETGAGKDTTYVHEEPGKYYFSVNAHSKWKMIIEQQQ